MNKDSLLIFFGIIIAGGMIALSNMYKAPAPTGQANVPINNQPTAQQPTAQPTGPRAFNLTIDADEPTLGLKAKEGDVVMIEFSDYHCPFCKRFHDQSSAELMQKYVENNKIQYVFMDYPLPSHDPLATNAAVGANCVLDQLGSDGYFAYKEAYFTKGATLGAEAPTLIAGEIAGVDMTAFAACLTARDDAEIKSDMQRGAANGINGTPGFIIGKLKGNTIEGELVSGAVPTANFIAAIERYLK